MFLVAANRLMVDLKESVMIGDRITDIVASSRAGISRNYLLLNDRSFELNFSEDAVGDEDSTYFSVIRELSEVVLATPSEIDKD
jgi:histidinol phosphatase-like enzyme